MTAVAGLIANLRGELAAAEDESVLSTAQLRNTLRRALMRLNRDFETGYLMVQDESVSPEMTEEHIEVLLQAAIPLCCRIEAAKAARRPSLIEAADLKVDRSKADTAWRDLGKTAEAEYLRLVACERERSQARVKPVVFECGSEESEE